jgi:hypothetical protein
MGERLDLSKHYILCVSVARGQQAKILHQSSADRTSSDRIAGWMDLFLRPLRRDDGTAFPALRSRQSALTDRPESHKVM